MTTNNKKTIVIGSRKSQLALQQTETVKKWLEEAHSTHQYEFVIKMMDTVGDRVLDVALSQIGDKGLFTKDLENGMFDGSIDMAVHSLKDMPTKLPPGLTIGAISKRENPLDCLVLHPKHTSGANVINIIDELPPGSVVGTSSLRRVAQLRHNFPHLVFKDIRGNLNTRLKKLDEANDYDAIVLAVAGLERLGWSNRIRQQFPTKISLYAVGQGALAVECKSDDKLVLSLLQKIHHKETAYRCLAERAMLRVLEGGCHVPVGVHSQISTDEHGYESIELEGSVLSISGDVCIKDKVVYPAEECEQAGVELANLLKKKGADIVLSVYDKIK